MFDRLKEILVGPRQDDGTSENEDNERRIQVATAVILLEVAHADDDYSASEQDRILQILRDRFSLNEESVADLVEVSEEQMKRSIDMWHFTEIINKNYNTEDKCRIIEHVWHVIYADGKLDKYEDHVVHKLARVLHLSHAQMIEAKLKYLPDDG
jgi:uncharacterized tellurite resistance protein B-like protein